MADNFPANFPTTLDSYTTLVDNTDNITANHPNARGSAIAAIEAKVGLDSSIVATSHDYLLTHLPGQAADVDIGTHEMRALTFESDQATGTAPFTVASTTVVTNLNSDTVDGKHVAGTNGAGEITTNDGTQTLTNKTLTSPTLTTPVITGGLVVAQGGTGSTAAANAASGVVVLDASSQLPAVSGALLTNLPAQLPTIKIGTFDRSFEAANGDVAYTGVGFQPRYIIFISGSPEYTASSVGWSDGTLNYAVCSGAGSIIVGSTSSTYCIYLKTPYYTHGAFVKSFDADGFTLTWVDSFPSGGQTTKYMAFK